MQHDFLLCLYSCKALIQKAINTCSIEVNTQNIYQNYVNNSMGLLDSITFSTSSSKSYHSELKKYNISFKIKKISIANITLKILTEIYKFSFQIQHLIAEEIYIVLKRLQDRKDILSLISAECSCCFFNYYLLLYHHVFYKQFCCNVILISNKIFEKSGLEVYQSHSLVDIYNEKCLLNEDLII
ncbi:LOW QUALITY PROTEIN: hypothetical protein BC938DRAFT_471251 [Jimgerdemannia flammicorona]|uniref:Uncharacterized protein n=1 Tax=Jimgerdemannia flammicorona TaxID=994334 RepID=A0A433QUQ5_9FUNG|nr:LOW QUALITY PROTEIN: hypothetical protein BC938DRAFT_471251 [Jimgerdemannia flammicorona]